MNLAFPAAVPEIPVRDIKEAATYYENNIGFALDWATAQAGLGMCSSRPTRWTNTRSTSNARSAGCPPP